MQDIHKFHTPQQILNLLDKHIIGQTNAKKSVAIALRNRWRRKQLSTELQKEIVPKNILMIGPTGVGKTEIARRLSEIEDAPFIKVEATKFTEVGYVGRDVESIIRDLAQVAYKKVEDTELAQNQEKILEDVENKILDALIPIPDSLEDKEGFFRTRAKIQAKLKSGKMEDKLISIHISKPKVQLQGIFPGNNDNEGLQEMQSQLTNLFSNFNNKQSDKKQLAIKLARKVLYNKEAEKYLDNAKLQEKTVEKTQEYGIVFLDEIDKITNLNSSHNGSVSREGVQRDLLPLIEGTNVNTKYGIIKTDYILFIASGAFHLSKPTDLIPELQGRLPIRVELNALTERDFYRILTEPNYSLIEQQISLLKVEGIDLDFTENALNRIANLAMEVNQNTDNIGARRLHTLVERLLEEISFHAPEMKLKNNNKIKIDQEYVDNKLAEIIKNQDLASYIL